MNPVLSCEHCGNPLALADERCPACGQAVPLHARRDAFLARAQRLAEAERWTEAAKALEPVLALALPGDELRLHWRQRGLWLLKSGSGEQLDLAEAALAESLRLDDSDPKSHHLWLDLLQRRGSVEKARQWYQQRAAADPGDAVALEQLKILKLADDFKAAPPPKLSIPAAESHSLFFKLLKPSPMKLISAALGALSSAFTLVFFTFGSGAKASAELQGIDGVSQAVDMMRDPWTNGITLLLCGAYLYWAWRRRRG